MTPTRHLRPQILPSNSAHNGSLFSLGSGSRLIKLPCATSSDLNEESAAELEGWASAPPGPTGKGSAEQGCGQHIPVHPSITGLGTGVRWVCAASAGLSCFLALA